MHATFINLLCKLQEETRKEADAIRWASETLEQLGLVPLLEIADFVTARQFYHKQGNCVTMYFLDGQKPNVMAILTDSAVPEWERSRTVSFDDVEGNYANWLYTDFDYWVQTSEDDLHPNLITARFGTKVKEGDEIDGCHVEKTEISGTRLSLKCDL